ncbi:hypothetical protein [Actinocrispum sp. NPDC049592]|uniref:hypothetical protein n=1 Tax=Actinocrispum sp. NPDC049592 TaxID=3154835 RepID=UPI00344A3E64
MTYANNEVDPGHSFPIQVNDSYPADGPLRQPTPLLRIRALAEFTQKHIVNVPKEDAAGTAGFVAIGYDEEGNQRGLIGIAEDLDDGLKADVLAFALAVFAGDSERIANSADGWLAIGRDRLAPAKEGIGYLAWHMLISCGRGTPSATFELLPIAETTSYSD